MIGPGALGGARATLRLARRDAWRNKGRSALIALMVFVPVVAAAVISVIARSDQLEPQDRVTMALGATAQARVVWEFDARPVTQDPLISGYGQEGDRAIRMPLSEFQQRLTAVLPAGDRLVASRTAVGRTFALGDRIVSPYRVNELDYEALGPDGPVRQISGHAPRAGSEVVVTQSLARHQNLHLGDRLTLVGTDRQFTIVGTVGGPGLIRDRQLIARPRAILEPLRDLTEPGTQTATWYVTGPEPVTWEMVQAINRQGALVLSREGVAHHPASADEMSAQGYLDPATLGITVVVAVLILLQVALMAGPAIAVGARRNERSLALIAATGAQPRQIGGVVLMTSAVIGLAASIAGVIAGSGLGAGIVALLRSAKEVGLPRTDIHAGDLMALVLAGTLAVTLAAVVPARAAARRDLVTGLNGRRPRVAASRRVSFLGLALIVAGAAGAWVAAGQGRPFWTVLALALLQLGLVASASAVVGLTARLAGRAPFAGRFAFRDAARQRSRTAPAVAAVLAAVAAGMTAAVFIDASMTMERITYSANVPVGTLQVDLPDTSVPERSSGLTAEQVTQATALVGSGLPVRSPHLAYEGKGTFVTVWGKGFCGGRGASCAEEGTSAVIVDPAAAEVFASGPDRQRIRAALSAGQVVSFARGAVAGGAVSVTVDPIDGSGQDGVPARIRLPAIEMAGPAHLDAVLLPVTVARRLGVSLVPTRIIATTTRAITTAERSALVARLTAIGVKAGLSVEAPYRDPSIQWIQAAYLGIAILVALAGTMTAVGLAAAEARPDLSTFAAVGASPRTRRRIGAAQAAAIAVPGAVLGGLGGLAGGWLLVRLNAATGAQWQDPSVWHYVVPAGPALLLVAGIPALAMAAGFLLVRSRLPLVRRLGQ